VRIKDYRTDLLILRATSYERLVLGQSYVVVKEVAAAAGWQKGFSEELANDY
jgi:hypothetical protein